MNYDGVMVPPPGQPLPPKGERAVALASHLRQAIQSGLVRPGARLPSVRALADAWGLSRFTAVEALDRLVAGGWAEARRGSGFYARLPHPAAGDGAPPNPAPHGPDMAERPDPSWWLGAMQRSCELSLSPQADPQSPAGLWVPGAGALPPSWYDQGLLTRALRASAAQPNLGLLYGAPEGLLAYRQALVRKLDEVGVVASLGQILSTQGATQALDMVAAALVQPGDAVLVDDPGYFLAFAQLAARGATVVGVPWVGDGPDLAALEALLQRHQPRFYFTTATLHNPTGGSLSPAKAHRVLRLCEAAGAWVVEDDFCCDLALHAPPRLAALDGLERVIYLGSFSKTLAPGWRVGYLAAPEVLIPRLLEAKQSQVITSAQVGEAAVASILADGAYRRHAARLRDRVAKARARSLKALGQAGFTAAEPAGEGMFIWAQGEGDSQALAEALWAQGILIAPGALFSPTGAASRWMRINVAAAENQALWAALAQANRQPFRSIQGPPGQLQ